MERPAARRTRAFACRDAGHVRGVRRVLGIERLGGVAPGRARRRERAGDDDLRGRVRRLPLREARRHRVAARRLKKGCDWSTPSSMMPIFTPWPAVDRFGPQSVVRADRAGVWASCRAVVRVRPDVRDAGDARPARPRARPAPRRRGRRARCRSASGRARPGSPARCGAPRRPARSSSRRCPATVAERTSTRRARAAGVSTRLVRIAWAADGASSVTTTSARQPRRHARGPRAVPRAHT